MSICIGDARHLPLRAESVQCCVTSPPYFGLRNYGVTGQIGLEPTPEEYVAQLVAAFREVWRVMKPDGTLWLNIGDSYAGSWGNQGRKESRGGQRPVNGPMMQPVHDGRYETARTHTGSWVNSHPTLKPKDLIGIPWMVAFALRADGWYLRSEIIWHKPNPMPESVTDRPTKSHEQVFLLTKQERYFYDHKAIQEPAVRGNAGSVFNAGKTALHQLDRASNKDREDDGMRNRRSVWTISTAPCAEAHFAVMPETLVEPCILAGSKPGDLILDPFAGSGTVGRVASKHLRAFVGVELKPDYATMAHRRQAGIQQSLMALAEVA